MGNKVETIGEYAFSECMGLIYVELSSSLSKVSKNLFAGCSYLEEVKINEGVTVIEENAFDSCVTLRRIHLPKSVKEIQKNAFLSCNTFGTVIYSGEEKDYVRISVTETGNDAFFNAELVIPEDDA